MAVMNKLNEKLNQKLKLSAINDWDLERYKELVKEDSDRLNEILFDFIKTPLYQRQMEELEKELNNRLDEKKENDKI